MQPVSSRPIYFLILVTLLALLLAGCRATFSGDNAVEPPPPTATPIPTATPTPFPTPTPTHTPTPQPVTATPIPSTPDRVAYVLTEAQINRLVGEGLAQQQDAPVSDVQVDLQPGQIVITARASLGFISVNVEVVATVPVSNCQPQPQIDSVTMNGGAIPGFLRDQIEGLILPYLQQFARADLGICVEQVVITDNELQTIGRYQ